MIRPARLAAVLAITLVLAGCTAAVHTTSAAKPAPTHALVAPTSVVPDLTKRKLALASAYAGSFELLVQAVDQNGEPVALADGQTRVILSQTPVAGVRVNQNSTVNVVVGAAAKVKVPNLRGKHETDVSDLLAGSAFDYTFVNDTDAINSDWHVVGQSPKAGSAVEPGTQIRLKVGAPQVVYKVFGNGSLALITWTGDTGNIGQAAGAHLPWSHSEGADGDFYSVSAQDDNGTSITCEIFNDGELVSKQTSTGRYTIAQCSN
jgi:hypothetical protein